jgi:RNA polymerase-interacting CarD/CdnL/TRCF family regulator
MAVESSNRSGGSNCAGGALAAIRACSDDLQTFVFGVFDQLEGLTDQLLARELDWQQTQRQTEREALQGQIDRLASVAAELAQTVAEQKQLAGKKSNDREITG